LRNPLPDLLASISASMLKVDFTGPASWSAQAALWVGVRYGGRGGGIGAILLAAAERLRGDAADSKTSSRTADAAVAPEMLLQLKMPQIVIPIGNRPAQADEVAFPFIDLGKGVAIGSIRCS